MKRTPSVLAIVMFLTTSSGVAAAAKPEIHIPEGFVDLTHGVPEPLAGKLPPAIEHEAQSFAQVAGGTEPGPFALAMDVDHVTNGASVVASKQKARMPDLSKSSELDEFVQALAKTSPPGTTCHLASANPVSVGAFRGSRILVDGETPVGALRMLIYILPLGDDTLTLLYSASRASFATYEPRFDASALATTGLANPYNGVFSMIQATATGVLVAIGASLIAARRKKKAAGTAR